MQTNDSEYVVVLHPRARVRFAYSADDGEVAGFSATVEYRRDGGWEGATQFEGVPTADVERDGLRISVYRDGERLLERAVPTTVVAGVLARYGPRLGRSAGQLLDRLVESDPSARATFEVYENGEEWHWRFVHDDGDRIAESAEGYASKRAALDDVTSVKRNALGAAVTH